MTRHLPCRLALGLLLGVGLARGEEPPDPENIAILDAVTVQTAADGVSIRLDFTAPVDFTSNKIGDPVRVFYDFPNTRPRADNSQAYEVQHPLLQRVRVGLFNEEPPTTRVVLDLPREQPVKAVRAEDGKTLYLSVGQGAGRPDREAPTPPTRQVIGAAWERETAKDSIYVVALSEIGEANAFYLSDPDRVVVDIDGAELKTELPQPGRANGVVAAVRGSQVGANVVRLVFELRAPAGYLLLKRLSPSRLVIRLTQGETAGRLVVVDAGHGGHDPGTTGYRPDLKEKQVNLAVARRVAQLLGEKGIRCALTRDDDTFVPLYDRPRYANSLGADLFVSIHCNAMPDQLRGQRSGTELYYYTDQSQAFASLMLREVAKEIGLPARGVMQRRFVVVRYTQMPAVLVELGYLDHAGDGAKLANPDFQRRCALGIVHGIVQQLQRMPRREALAETAGG